MRLEEIQKHGRRVYVSPKDSIIIVLKITCPRRQCYGARRLHTPDYFRSSRLICKELS